MNQNLVGSIYGMSSMKIAHFFPILNKKVLEGVAIIITSRWVP
jgi:hypothetical protein